MTQKKSPDRCPQNDPSVVAELIGASKRFGSGDREIVALQETDLVLTKGQMLLIVGPSGSGKTTLLSLLGCVLYPSEGCVCIQGVNTNDLNDRQLARLRRSVIGFVFQNFNLISPLTTEENIRVPLILNKLPKDAVRERARRAQELVGLTNRRRSLPKQLSGGEQQRVAIARALLNNPAVILADEPTGNLDSKTGDEIMNIFRRLNEDQKKTLIIITHDPDVGAQARRRIFIRDGLIVREENT
jgi:putative ABC transport system ATP-binding protein